VFSNSLQENIQVRFNKTLSGKTVLKLLGIDGKVIFSNTINNGVVTGESITLPAKNNSGRQLNSGLYLLSVNNNGICQIIKTLIQ
jgi:hypothetical protein